MLQVRQVISLVTSHPYLPWINRQERLQTRNELTRETKRHESTHKSSRVRQNERTK